jgi:hypothetical protein
MKRVTFVVALAAAAVLFARVDAAAQARPAATSDTRVTQRIFDNFAQASAREPKENISATGIENVTTVPLQGRWRLYGRGEVLMYERFGTSPLLGIGARHDGRRHVIHGSLYREWQRPIVDVDDTFGEADTLVLGGQYGYRPTRRWRVSATTHVRKNDFERDTFDSHTYDVGGSVRYQLSGRRFMPSVGVASGRRDSVNPRDDFSQLDRFVRVQSEFSDVRLSARYRHRSRDYTIPDETSRNFARDDTRRQLVLSAEVPVFGGLAAIAYYAVERNRSTRVDRRFTTQFFSIGLSWRVRFSEPPEPPDGR